MDGSRFTRAAGLDLLHAVTPTLGRRYGVGRNFAEGAGGEPTTTALSPFVRRRLLSEEELVRTAVEAHGRRDAERFVQEVFWRSYFKGHLETRPSIWSDYGRQLAQGRERLEANTGLRHAYAEAVEGRTGVDGFDDWARTLAADGWLHNHVRMWFASIWIFTLRLPWALGADFFMRHLLDGDPASNTLSWRWVAGLHTRGRPYAARADNIARYTHGRFSPHGLNEAPEPLEEEVDHPLVAPPPSAAQPPAGEVALLLHVDDLVPETLDLGTARVTRVAGLHAHPSVASAHVAAADDAAMADALARAGAAFGCPVADAAADTLGGWAKGLPVVAAWAPVGPSADALPSHVLRLRSGWDERAWPHATRGYFKMRTAIPALLDAAGVPP